MQNDNIVGKPTAIIAAIADMWSSPFYKVDWTIVWELTTIVVAIANNCVHAFITNN